MDYISPMKLKFHLLTKRKKKYVFMYIKNNCIKNKNKDIFDKRMY